MNDNEHVASRVISEVAHYPEHGPRASDPNYHIFNAARKKLIHELKVGCWIGGATLEQIKAGLVAEHKCFGASQLEAHHEVAEFAGLNAVDWKKIAIDFPQADIHSNEDFLKFAESEGGLTILCDKHHRGAKFGIHMLSYPVWKLDRYALGSWEFLG